MEGPTFHGSVDQFTAKPSKYNNAPSFDVLFLTRLDSFRQVWARARATAQISRQGLHMRPNLLMAESATAKYEDDVTLYACQ